MTVYVVIALYAYEGYDKPIAIYKDKQKAVARAEKLQKSYDKRDVEIEVISMRLL